MFRALGFWEKKKARKARIAPLYKRPWDRAESRQVLLRVSSYIEKAETYLPQAFFPYKTISYHPPLSYTYNRKQGEIFNSYTIIGILLNLLVTVYWTFLNTVNYIFNARALIFYLSSDYGPLKAYLFVLNYDLTNTMGVNSFKKNRGVN